MKAFKLNKEQSESIGDLFTIAKAEFYNGRPGAILAQIGLRPDGFIWADCHYIDAASTDAIASILRLSAMVKEHTK